MCEVKVNIQQFLFKSCGCFMFLDIYILYTALLIFIGYFLYFLTVIILWMANGGHPVLRF